MFIDFQNLTKTQFLHKLERIEINHDYWSDATFTQKVVERINNEDLEYFTRFEDIKCLLTMYLRSIREPKASGIKVEPMKYEKIENYRFSLTYKFKYHLSNTELLCITEFKVLGYDVDNPMFEFCPKSEIPELERAINHTRSMKHNGRRDYATLTRASMMSKWLMEHGWEPNSGDYYQFEDGSFRLGFGLRKGKYDLSFNGYEFKLYDGRWFDNKPHFSCQEPQSVWQFAEDVDCVATNRKDVYDVYLKSEKDGNKYIHGYIKGKIHSSIGSALSEFIEFRKGVDGRYRDNPNYLPKGYTCAEVKRNGEVVARCDSKDTNNLNNWKIL